MKAGEESGVAGAVHGDVEEGDAVAVRGEEVLELGLRLYVRAAAALEILWIVLGQWSASDGQEEFGKLLDAAFAAFSTPARQQADTSL